MSRKELGFVAPLSLAIATGASTPNPGSPGVVVWSSTLSRNVYWDGSNWHPVTSLTTGTTAPSNPAVGDVWIDTN